MSVQECPKCDDEPMRLHGHTAYCQKCGLIEPKDYHLSGRNRDTSPKRPKKKKHIWILFNEGDVEAYHKKPDAMKEVNEIMGDVKYYLEETATASHWYLPEDGDHMFSLYKREVN